MVFWAHWRIPNSHLHERVRDAITMKQDSVTCVDVVFKLIAVIALNEQNVVSFTKPQWIYFRGRAHGIAAFSQMNCSTTTSAAATATGNRQYAVLQFLLLLIYSCSPACDNFGSGVIISPIILIFISGSYHLLIH